MILRAAQRLGIEAKEYDDLPEVTKEHYSFLRYEDIIAPMVVTDRKVKGSTYGQLAIKYGVTERKIEYIFCCRTKFDID